MSRSKLSARPALTAALASLPACNPSEEANPDPRTTVLLTTAQRHAVLLEMRTMLQSLHDVLAAMQFGDTAMMIRAANG
ncbi:MAG TPA: hypothetical protein VNL98_09665 [Gemmatimonadales bacterium]|nr:hypothetical protein [Gemmatimonadales bacterium]